MRTLLFLLALSSCAFAEEQSPQLRALSAKLGAEINANLVCGAQAIDLQDKLAAAQADLKALKDKYEPKAPKP